MSGQLLARTRDARERLNQLAALREGRNLTFAITQRLQGLENALNSLSGILDLLKEVSEGVSEAERISFHERASSVALLIATLATATQSPATAALASTGPLLESLTRLTELVNAAALRAWFDLASQRPSGRQAELLSTLGRFEDFREHAKKLRELHAQLDRLAQSPRPDPASVRLFKEKSAEWEQTWAPIEEQLPEDVAAFLTAATGDGAELAELTDGVRSWISKYSVAHLFRIRVS